MNLYPELDPYREDFLVVSKRHKIYFEESGNRKGKPVLFLHGGPGFGTTPEDRRFFDPVRYRIIMFDQRGSGKSLPQGELEGNTTQHLVEDIESLRKHLAVNKWVVLGGSWGSTLALVYAEAFPERVSGLILRSVFTMRDWEMDWYFREGVNRIFPDYWAPLVESLGKRGKEDVLKSLFEQLGNDSETIRARVISLFDALFFKTTDINSRKPIVPNENISPIVFSAYKILLYYFVNQGFLKKDQILKEVNKIKKIPTMIIHGRGDMVCPLGAAWDLHRCLSKSNLEIIPGAGHGTRNLLMRKAIIKCTDDFAKE
ncbi:prolyl aminopeptidase [Patescibacteria group bacterium]